MCIHRHQHASLVFQQAAISLATEASQYHVCLALRFWKSLPTELIAMQSTDNILSYFDIILYVMLYCG